MLIKVLLGIGIAVVALVVITILAICWCVVSFGDDENDHWKGGL